MTGRHAVVTLAVDALCRLTVEAQASKDRIRLSWLLIDLADAGVVPYLEDGQLKLKGPANTDQGLLLRVKKDEKALTEALIHERDRT